MYLFIRSSTNPGPRVSRIIKYFASNKKNIVYLSPHRSGDDVNESFRDLRNLGTYELFKKRQGLFICAGSGLWI